MSNDTIPALALGYIIASGVYVFWVGLKNLLDIIDTSMTMAVMALIFLASVAVLAHYLRRKSCE